MHNKERSHNFRKQINPEEESSKFDSFYKKHNEKVSVAMAGIITLGIGGGIVLTDLGHNGDRPDFKENGNPSTFTDSSSRVSFESAMSGSASTWTLNTVENEDKNRNFQIEIF